MRKLFARWQADVSNPPPFIQASASHIKTRFLYLEIAILTWLERYTVWVFPFSALESPILRLQPIGLSVASTRTAARLYLPPEMTHLLENHIENRFIYCISISGLIKLINGCFNQCSYLLTRSGLTERFREITIGTLLAGAVSYPRVGGRQTELRRLTAS